MTRYLKLLGIFYRYSMLQDLEYRVSFLAHVGMSAFWTAWAVFGIAVLFQHRDKVGDWSYGQVLMVAALFTLFNGLMDAFWRPNVGAVISQIRDGSFDFVLVKPINAQFMSSLRSIVVWRLADVALGIGLIGYALGLMRITPSPIEIASFLLMLVLGTLIMYSLWLMMVSLAFWLVKVENITEIFSAFYEAGRYPVTVYPALVRAVLTFIVPVAFVTTFPASALQGKLDGSTMAQGLVLALFFFVVSNRFWNVALRRYTSASS